MLMQEKITHARDAAEAFVASLPESSRDLLAIGGLSAIREQHPDADVTLANIFLEMTGESNFDDGDFELLALEAFKSAGVGRVQLSSDVKGRGRRADKLSEAINSLAGLSSTAQQASEAMLELCQAIASGAAGIDFELLEQSVLDFGDLGSAMRESLGRLSVLLELPDLQEEGEGHVEPSQER